MLSAVFLALMPALADAQGCNLWGIPSLCQKSPPRPGAKLDELCRNHCIQAMMACADNPLLANAVGADTATKVKQMHSQCGGGAGSGGKGAGDGKCSVPDLIKYNQDHEQKKKQNGGKDGKGEFTMQDCKLPLYQEMFDCVNNPMFAKQKKDILMVQQMCSAKKGKAGDGECNIGELMRYSKQNGKGKSPDCKSEMMQEMFDCLDHPVMAKNRKQMVQMQQMCQKDQKGCVAKIQADLGHWFSKGGVCCPPGEKCNQDGDTSGPPSKCTKPCAKVFSPFVHQCGETLIKFMQNGKDATDGSPAEQVRDFSAKCFKAQHDIEGKGGMAADGTCKMGGFCNFDYGNAGKCESCLPSRDACNSDGLPPKGARECVNTCFMRMKPARCGSGQAPPPPPPPPNPWGPPPPPPGGCGGKCPANQCLYQGKCISHVNQAACGSHKGTWCGGGH